MVQFKYCFIKNIQVFFLEVVKNQCESEWRKTYLGLSESFHSAWKEGLLEVPAAFQSTHRGGETLREKREFGKKLRKSSLPALLQGNVPTSCLAKSRCLS